MLTPNQIELIHAEVDGENTPVQSAEVQKLVHSLAVDTDTHRVYAPEQEADGMPAARIVIYEPVPLPKADCPS